ncbi:hypothetical protein [Lentilactobacillus kisonensis]|uniref:AbrB family transcriptional regulator n=1 Tax=Lentilactobacillus kisonensis DSM 19906 = JCM 15041 TaxID=1423766 RepID=A0A0R1NRS2_9LACO|nr:hypothetical protein [Lentilactobacillus kisonensis]KRL20322.1 hypothetical protein FC98_GL001732 [Lentilactobacillus kisonensis DSM 19906 = JCM 15041]
MQKREKQSGRIAGSFVARRSGNSLSLTIPADAEVKEGAEYVLEILDDGTLKYKPQQKNIWHTEKAQNYDFRSDLKKINYAEEKRFGKEI